MLCDLRLDKRRKILINPLHSIFGAPVTQIYYFLPRKKISVLYLEFLENVINPCDIQPYSMILFVLFPMLVCTFKTSKGRGSSRGKRKEIVILPWIPPHRENLT